MKRLPPVIAILAYLIVPQMAQAQSDASNQLAKVSEIFVSVDDGIEDGCLPSPKLLRVEAEQILQRSGFRNFRSGFRIFEATNYLKHELLITAIGGKTKTSGGRHPAGACVASIRIRLGRFDLLEDGTSAYNLSFDLLNHYYGAKAGFQTLLGEAIGEMVTELANEIMKARSQRTGLGTKKEAGVGTMAPIF